MLSRKTNGGPAYTVEIREQGKRLSLDAIPDPFIRTTLRPRGWRAALALLRGRYELEVLVSSDPVTCNAVMELDPDYLGPAGSPSREAWNAHVQQALGDMAARAGEATDD
jgi:hypothetical protein